MHFIQQEFPFEIGEKSTWIEFLIKTVGVGTWVYKKKKTTCLVIITTIECDWKQLLFIKVYVRNTSNH